MCRRDRLVYGIVAEPVRLRSVGTEQAVCDLESMSFAFRPLVQHLTHDSGLINTARARFDLQPHVSGLGNSGAQVFKGKGHVVR